MIKSSWLDRLNPELVRKSRILKSSRVTNPFQITEITDAAKIESQPQNGVSENGSGFSGGYNETYLNVLANAAYSTSQAMQNSSIIAQMKKNGYEM